ncbi:amino acid transmembrane transporter [Pseudohyphozyma bogoriensis]|nr:amino acid transmembrane transporter [Pseudohyphozyma bogoriensis]
MDEPFSYRPTLPTSTSDLEKSASRGEGNAKENGNLDLPGLSEDAGLERQLKSRHIQMISLGGVIGTGLFLVSGGFITLGQRFVDPAFSFLQGWLYWYNWVVTLPAELSAAAVLIGYWNDTVNPAVWITVCLVVAVGINLGGARAYGEMEFWFAIIKILTIVGLIVLGIVLTAGGGPDHKAIGFRYWHNPGPFVQYMGIAGSKGRFLGFWAVLVQASYSYLGTEIVAIAAGEAANPKKTLPRAIKTVYIRILMFYIVGTFVIGLLVSSADPRLDLSTGTAISSPFVIAINNAGIKGLPGLVNACLLTAAWSAASSDLYTASRALYGLSVNGNAPRVFAKLTPYGLPWVSLLVCVLVGLLSYMSAGAHTAGQVFNYFADMTSVCGLIGWAGICYTYIRWYNGMKAQGIDRDALPYRAPLQPYLTWYSMIACCVILFFSGFQVFINIDGDFDQGTFWTTYIPIIICPFLYFPYKWYYRCTTVSYDQMDFVSGSRVEEEEEEELPHGFWARLWKKITL